MDAAGDSDGGGAPAALDGGPEKLAIVSEVGVNGAGVADVARRHGLERQQIYQWRRELVRKGLVTVEPATFLPVAFDRGEAESAIEEPAYPVEIRLAKGRSLAVTTDVPSDQVQRLIQAVEGA